MAAPTQPMELDHLPPVFLVGAWVNDQATCFEASRDHLFFVVQDATYNGRPTKRYSSARSAPAPGQRFAEDFRHGYELIRTEIPRFMGFDFDVNPGPDSPLEGIRADPAGFLEEVRAAGEEVFGELFGEAGVVTGSMQVKTAHSPNPAGKMSFHIRLP